MRPQSRPAAAPLLAALTLAASALTACGGDNEPAGDEASRAAPEASTFPSGDGTLEELASSTVPGDDLVVSPAGGTYTEGRNRFAFAVFTLDREQVTDADVAIYASPGPDGEAGGPYPARVESVETEPAFTAQSTSADPDAAKVVYVTDVVLDQPGEWRLLALVREGDETVAVRMPSITVPANDPIPAPGERAPRVHTPTTEDVGGNVARIDTRVPPSTMHEHDLAGVLGERPVVLVFATPALCQTRVCGPLVDIAEQVKRDVGDEAAFIHMEIFEDNDPNKGVREQVAAYNLQTEPWVFVIDENGRIDTRIEGILSVAELTDAVERVTG
ncbi:MAG: hypothetical protein ACRDKX_00675 [Solirubrobacterales bacterium]